MTRSASFILPSFSSFSRLSVPCQSFPFPWSFLLMKEKHGWTKEKKGKDRQGREIAQREETNRKTTAITATLIILGWSFPWFVSFPFLPIPQLPINNFYVTKEIPKLLIGRWKKEGKEEEYVSWPLASYLLLYPAFPWPHHKPIDDSLP